MLFTLRRRSVATELVAVNTCPDGSLSWNCRHPEIKGALCDDYGSSFIYAILRMQILEIYDYVLIYTEELDTRP